MLFRSDEALEEAAKVSESFFNDDVIEGVQIARAIRERMSVVVYKPKDDSFVIKTMSDVLARANARRR